MRIRNRKIFATAIAICLFFLVIGETSAVPSNGLPMRSKIETSSISIKPTLLCDADNVYPGAPIDFNYLVVNDGMEDIYVSLSLHLETSADSGFSKEGKVPDDWEYDAAEDKYNYSIEGMYKGLTPDWIYSAVDDRYYYKEILAPGISIPLFVVETPANGASYTMHIPAKWGKRTMGIEIDVIAAVTAIQAKNINNDTVRVQFNNYPYWPV